MGFYAGTEEPIYIERILRGKHRKVAVGCWFTSSGRGIPKLIRYEDEEGCIQTIQNIQVLTEDPRRYTGNMSRKYRCASVIHGIRREFFLLYHPDTNKWDMIIPEE